MPTLGKTISLVFSLFMLALVLFYFYPVSNEKLEISGNQNIKALVADFNDNRSSESLDDHVGYGDSDNVFLLPVNDSNYVDSNKSLGGSASVSAKASGLYDVALKQFTFTNNIDKQLPLASITKLMTAMVVLDHIASSESIEILPEYLNVDGDGADLFAYEKIRADDLLSIMLVGSINDAALAFQGYLKNKNIDLITEMNNKAKQIGMTRSRFYDPAGLSDEGYSTVRDIVRMAQEVESYPLIWDKLRRQNFQATSTDGKQQHNINNTNKLLGVLPGIIGGKTGYTLKANGCIVLVISDKNKKIISVVLGSDDRFGTTKRLLTSWNQ